MSRYVESWRAGDTAFWRGPFGDFCYKPNQVSESSGDPPPRSLASRAAASGFRISPYRSSRAQTQAQECPWTWGEMEPALRNKIACPCSRTIHGCPLPRRLRLVCMVFEALPHLNLRYLSRFTFLLQRDCPKHVSWLAAWEATASQPGTLFPLSSPYLHIPRKN